MMIDIMQNIFGEYVPLTGDGLASLNVEYICGVVLFGIVLFAFFKLLGGIIKNV